MGYMKSWKNWAWSSLYLYLAIITSFKDQFWSFGMRLRAPSLLTYLRPFAPRCDIFLGNRPINSMIWAKWSSFFPKEPFWSFFGLNNSYPVRSSKVIQANDHISALRLYFDPRSTSGLRYCLVWIYVAKWWCSQQAFPRSAILTLTWSEIPELVVSNDILCLKSTKRSFMLLLGLPWVVFSSPYYFFVFFLYCWNVDYYFFLSWIADSSPSRYSSNLWSFFLSVFL